MKGRNAKIQEKSDQVTTTIHQFRETVPLQILNVVDGIAQSFNAFPENLIRTLQTMNLKQLNL
jgi:hypothetical protein